MISNEEAQNLMEELISLRKIAQETNAKSDIQKVKKQEAKCVDKFSYLVTMKIGKYKSFNNYEDLKQEGFEALLMGMKNYNPKKGSAFWWFHKYIDTRISRSANLHTTIRYPLKVAKETTPHKEAIMPTLIEERYCPDKQLENMQSTSAIYNAIEYLDNTQKQIVNLTYGLTGDKPMSINKICKELNITRSKCLNNLNSAITTMKENIKL